jgi:uncharacterized membrane protein YvlD (DUF360 family)
MMGDDDDDDGEKEVHDITCKKLKHFVTRAVFLAMSNQCVVPFVPFYHLPFSLGFFRLSCNSVEMERIWPTQGMLKMMTMEHIYGSGMSCSVMLIMREDHLAAKI